MPEHPGFQHSGHIGDGAYVYCLGCGAMASCYEPDETGAHEASCPRSWADADRAALLRRLDLG